MTTDERLTYIACQTAQQAGQEIDDATARTIASWYVGHGEGEVEFVTTGAIVISPSELWRKFTIQGVLYTSATAKHRLMLDMLGTYLLKAGKRGPVEGWSKLWVRA